MCLNNKHILEVTFIEKLSSYINLNKLKALFSLSFLEEIGLLAYLSGRSLEQWT